MPLPTFEKLSPRKKQRLLEAAMSEFARLPYDRVSVFEIARSAEISRSSFYYYFSDKEDLYRYLLDQLRDELIDSLPDEVGLLDFPALILDFFAAQRETGRGPFVARLLERAQLWAQGDLTRTRTPGPRARERIRIRDTERLERINPEDLRLLSFIFWECCCYRLNAYYRGEITLSELHAGMNRLIELLDHGISGTTSVGEGS